MITAGSCRERIQTGIIALFGAEQARLKQLAKDLDKGLVLSPHRNHIDEQPLMPE
jgi:hypothetical protein